MINMMARIPTNYPDELLELSIILINIEPALANNYAFVCPIANN